LIFWLALTVAACDQSPTGRTQVTLVPDQQMAAIGARTFDEMLRQQAVVRDAAMLSQVRCITRALVDSLPNGQGDQGDWTLAVFEESTPNAFALPGRKIGINSGMLRVASTPDQLAAVIAHEIGHVIADHSNERLTQQLAVQGGLMLVDLLAEEPGSLAHEALRRALGLGAQYGVLLPYSRTHETEADLIGLELMADAGFDPRASLTLWQKMASAADGAPLEFLSTHPSNARRLEDLAAAMDAALERYRDARAAGRRPDCA
jgi:predicted Zn-dependent protease